MAAPAPTVLIVEDDRLVRMTLRFYLENQGCDVIEAATAADAVRLGDSAPRLDLLITDLLLPDRRGRALADELRGRRPALAVLFISALADLEPDIEVLQKPFDEEQLAAHLRGLLGT